MFKFWILKKIEVVLNGDFKNVIVKTYIHKVTGKKITVCKELNK